MVRTLLWVILLSVCYSFCEAQIFGGTSPAVKWNQITIPQARIIFPAGMDSLARLVAVGIRVSSAVKQLALGAKTKKVNIVLRNEGLISNGYVGLGPFRSEFYLTPPQNSFSLGSVPWPEQLAFHEFRHVQQYNNFDVGLSHFMRVLFGAEGQELANAGSVPDWFFEGDAVNSETVLTGQGRGVIPYFYNGYRALKREGRKYSWMKMRNGSYLHFVPDKYPLGYMLTAYGREKYGNEFWQKVTGDAARFSPLFYPWQGAVRKYSGLDYAAFRDSAFSFFDNQFDDPPVAPPKNGFVQNEQFAVYTPGDSLIFLKNSVKDIPAFMIRGEGRERKIRVADVMLDNYFSYRNGKIVYASRRYHPRWVSRAYSEIQILDTHTGVQKTITRKTRYFSPDINEAGDKIIAVNSGEDGAVTLDLLDASSGQLLNRLAPFGIINFAYPKFYHEDILCVITRFDGSMSIATINMTTEEIHALVPFSKNVIGFPVVKGDTLYFSASRDKNDELFAYQLTSRQLWKVIAPDFTLGKYHPAISGDSVAWSSFTSEGQRLQIYPRKQIVFEEMFLSDYYTEPYQFGISEGVDAARIRDSLGGDTVHETKKYGQLTSPINFHSLEPGADDPEYSLSLIGENILNTVQTNLSFTYNRSDRSKQAGLNILYGGLFPVLSFGYNYQIDRRFAADSQFVYYNVSSPHAGLYIPLTLSRRRSVRSLSFGSDVSYEKLIVQRPFKDRYQGRSTTVLTNSVSFSNQSQTAGAQVAPRFAQTVSLNYKIPVGSTPGYQYQLAARLFLPGMSKTHSLNFTVAYSQRDTFNFVGFSSSFPFSRGYEGVMLPGLLAGRANYQFPVLYPEAGIADIVYFLRVRANLFYDYTHANAFTTKGEKWKRNFTSTGIELNFDTRWWNQNPVTFGIRYSRLLNDDFFGGSGRNRWEILLPVNLFNNQ